MMGLTQGTSSTAELLRRAACEGRIIFVVSGPAGVGKSTVARRAVSVIPGLSLNVSCTTRSPRPAETPGKDYHFLSEAEFKRLAEGQELLEWAEVHGNNYGTRASDVLNIFSKGRDALLEIDIQGGVKVRSGYPRTVLIFLVAPSQSEAKRRLLGRGTETEAEVLRRLARGKEELRQSRQYNYLIMNDEVDTAVNEFKCIVVAERARLTEERYRAIVDGVSLV